MGPADFRPTYRGRAVMRSDRGLVRERNEDAAYIDPDGEFFVIADGVGGYPAGDVASTMAVELVRQRLDAARVEIDAYAVKPSEARRDALEALLVAAVTEAHAAVYERAQAEPDKYGMATTLDVLLVAGTDAFVAHVGDSRVYLVRDGAERQLTSDHTIAEMIPGRSPITNVLLNAVGMSPEITIDLLHEELQPGDRLVLCTDGLYAYFPGDELAMRVGSGSTTAAMRELIDLARTRGGHDNITGVIIEVAEVPIEAPRVTRSGYQPQLRVIRTDRDEETMPNTPFAKAKAAPPPLAHPARGTMPPPRRASASGSLSGPLGAVNDDALDDFVEYSLYEEDTDVPYELEIS